MGLCACTVMRVALIDWSPSRARAGASVLLAEGAAWRTLRLTLWIGCCLEVPVRQWVLSLPFALRYRLAYDAPLTSAVLGIFMRALFGSLRRRARKQWNVKGNEVKWKQAKGREGEGERVEAGKGEGEQCGAVTFVQRFGGALNLNIHFHCLVLDGVYAAGPKGKLRFHPLPPPSDAEVARVAGQVAQRDCPDARAPGAGPRGRIR